MHKREPRERDPVGVCVLEVFRILQDLKRKEAAGNGNLAGTTLPAATKDDGPDRPDTGYIIP